MCKNWLVGGALKKWWCPRKLLCRLFKSYFFLKIGCLLTHLTSWVNAHDVAVQAYLWERVSVIYKKKILPYIFFDGWARSDPCHILIRFQFRWNKRENIITRMGFRTECFVVSIVLILPMASQTRYNSFLFFSFYSFINVEWWRRCWVVFLILWCMWQKQDLVLQAIFHVLMDYLVACKQIRERRKIDHLLKTCPGLCFITNYTRYACSGEISLTSFCKSMNFGGLPSLGLCFVN